MFSGKTIYVCVDSDEDTYFYVVDDAEAEAYFDENPDADQFEVATTIGRELTSEEMAALPSITGALAY